MSQIILRRENELFKFIVIIMAIVVTIGLITFFTINDHRTYKKEILTQTQKQLQLLANSEAKSLQEKLKSVADGLQSLAQNPFIFKINAEQKTIHQVVGYQPGLMFYQDHDDIINSFYRIDKKGLVLERRPLREDRIYRDHSKKPGVAYTLEYQKPIVSFLTADSGRKSLSICVPVISNPEKQFGNFGGVLRALIYLDVLSERFEHIAIDGKGYAWLEDIDERIVAHADREKIGKLHAEKNGERDVLQAHAAVDILNLKLQVGVLLPYQDIAEPVNKHALNIAIILMLSITFSGGLGFILFHMSKKQIQLETNSLARKNFEILFNNISDAIFVHDLNGRILEVNDTACQNLKYSKEELLNMKFASISSLDNRKKAQERTRLVVQSGMVTYEGVYLTKTGDEVPVEVVSKLTRYQGQNAIVTTARDISERKKLEYQFQHAQKMKAIGSLAGGIAHDFNNILMGIEGNASLLLMDAIPGTDEYKTAKIIQQLTKRGAGLTKQLLGFARGGKYEVLITDLNNLIQKTVEMFGSTKKEITINKDFSVDLWSVEVDRGQIEQVLMNLFVNASQAMTNGGKLYLKTENVTNENILPDSRPGNYVKISITDTGRGMDEETQQRIFDPFFTTRGMGRGTGLGLASVYGIVKSHNGVISVSSKLREGTTFEIYLPAMKREVIEEKQPEDDWLIKGKETILFVDDEKVIVDVGEKMLKALGYKVFLATNGHDAVEIYRKNQENIDLVILDMIIPGDNSEDIYSNLRGVNPQVKVLLASGYSFDGQAAQLLAKGCCNGFIQKPFSLNDLSRKLKQLIH